MVKIDPYNHKEKYLAWKEKTHSQIPEITKLAVPNIMIPATGKKVADWFKLCNSNKRKIYKAGFYIKNMAEITGRFDWEKPEVVPAFIQGADAKAVYDSLTGSMKSAVSFDNEKQLLTGSNVFVAARIDTLLKPLGIRVANARDLNRPEIMRMIQGDHYTDAPALVLRSLQDSYPRNIPLIRQLNSEVEKANGSVKLPVLITGFDVKIIEGDENGYGLAIVPRDDFKAVYDERLDGKFDCKKFDDVDELGLPKFYANGKRTWYAQDLGLSMLCLLRRLDLSSRNVDLAGSDGLGRVVVVSGEATAKNLEGKL